MSFERISIDPDRMQGLPCIRGTRVTVSAVLGQLAADRCGMRLLVDENLSPRVARLPMAPAPS